MAHAKLAARGPKDNDDHSLLEATQVERDLAVISKLLSDPRFTEHMKKVQKLSPLGLAFFRRYIRECRFD